MNDFEFDPFESYAKIVVIGVGGAGSNAVNKMLEDKSESVIGYLIPMLKLYQLLLVNIA